MIEWLLAAIVHLGAPTALAPAIVLAAVEAPLPRGPRHTAALLLAVGWYEGGLRADTPRSDAGETCTTYQVRVGRARCDELEHDPLAAAREARERIRGSLERCRALPESDRLAAYASGSCASGRALARGRWFLARWLEKRA